MNSSPNFVFIYLSFWFFMTNQTEYHSTDISKKAWYDVVIVVSFWPEKKIWIFTKYHIGRYIKRFFLKFSIKSGVLIRTWKVFTILDIWIWIFFSQKSHVLVFFFWAGLYYIVETGRIYRKNKFAMLG